MYPELPGELTSNTDRCGAFNSHGACCLTSLRQGIFFFKGNQVNSKGQGGKCKQVE